MMRARTAVQVASPLLGLVITTASVAGAPRTAPTHPPVFSTPLPNGIGALHDVATADLNDDDHHDLIGITNATLKVLLGRGDATFDPQPEHPFPPGSDTQLVVRDLNADGAPDAVVTTTSADARTVVVYLNDGSGALNPTEHAAPQPIGFPNARTLVADFTGDGAPDILTRWSVSDVVLINQGDGTFAEPTAAANQIQSVPLPLPRFAGRLAAELTGDAAADLVNWDDTHVTISRSLADGTFQELDSIDFPTSPDGKVRAADLDDDGDTDLVVPGEDRVAILRNDGTGHVAPEIYIHEAGDVADIADTNGDHKPDIVLTNIGGLGTLLNDGAGVFNTARQYEDADYARFVVGDVDSDLDEDVILLPRLASTTVLALLNDGTGVLAGSRTFDFGVSRAVVTPRINSLAVCDLDGDHLNDLVAIIQQSDTAELRILFADAPQHTATVPLCPCDSGYDLYPQDLQCADFDNDGNVDVAMVVDGVRIYKNDGAGNLTLGHTVGTYVYRYTIADLTGDTIPDIATLGDSGIAIYAGVGDGAFDDLTAIDPGQWFDAISAADLTGDHVADLILRGGDYDVYTFNNPGDGMFTGTPQPLGLSAVTDTSVSDADQDGDLDVWASTYNAGPVLLLNDGAGNLTPSPLPQSGDADQIAAADMDADGIDDVLTGLNDHVSETRAYIHLLNVLAADGHAGLVMVESPDRDTYPYPWLNDALVRDLDDDGQIDVFAHHNDSPYSLFRRGLGDGTFEASPRTYIGPASGPTDAADFNEDGLLDILGDGPQLLLADGAPGRFGSFRTLDDAPSGYSRAFADINADGILDVAINADSPEPHVVFLLGDGLGGFTPAGETTTSVAAFAMTFADVTGSPQPDLIVSDLVLNVVRVFENRGNAHFVPAWSTPISLPWRLSAADLNRDGLTDVVVGSLEDTGVHVLINDARHAFDVAILPFAPETSTQRFALTGDIDADGAIDILAQLSEDPTTVYPFFNNGDGTFDAATPVDLPDAFDSATLADLNHDHRADLVYATSDVPDPSMVVRPGRADRTFGPPETIAPIPSYARTYRVGDATGDGWPDVFALWGGDILLIPSAGNGAFGEPEYYLGPVGDDSTLELIDIEGNDTRDAAIFDPMGYNSTTIHLNRLAPPPHPCPGDFDHDADTDVTDLSTFLLHFGEQVAIGTNGDIDNDADVDIFDFALFAPNFGCTLAR